jgi:hypothetical protein
MKGDSGGVAFFVDGGRDCRGSGVYKRLQSSKFNFTTTKTDHIQMTLWEPEDCYAFGRGVG